ncbi:MAG: hypothetical protein ACFUZC_01060 [Chthoniobacteraceae bacterium]
MKSNKPFFAVLGALAGLCVFTIFLTYYDEWSSHRMHAQEIERAFNERLLPATTFVRNFVERENRLPSDEELESAGWPRGTTGHGTNAYVHIYRERPQWLDSWGVVGRDFLLETAVPDWNLYYRSWDNQRIEANWP